MNNLKLPVQQDADLKGKVVLVRVDHNVVKSGKIIDAYRIDATIGTICSIFAKGGKPILMTHVGRPKDKKTGEIACADKTAVSPIVSYLEEKLSIKIGVPQFKPDGMNGISHLDNTVMQPFLEDLKNGKIDMIYLPNTRWFSGEESKTETGDTFAKELAALADVFINDAFGSWQAHSSTVKITKFLPSYLGHLMQKEIVNLDKIYNPKAPLLAVVAGSKFDTKIESLNALIQKADYLVLGGVIYNAYLCAKYGFTIKGIEDDDMKIAGEFVEFAKKFPNKLIELPYIVESDTLDGKFAGQYRTHKISDIKAGTQLNYVLDADPKSFDDENVKKVFLQAKTIFVNAVMGFTPNFGKGTRAMDMLIDQNKEAMKMYGGGDTLQELKTLCPGLYMEAIDNSLYYYFTGGGAVLKAIENGTITEFPTIKAVL